MYCNDNWKNEKDVNQHPHIAQQKLLNGKRKTTLKRYLYHKYLNYRTHAVHLLYSLLKIQLVFSSFNEQQ